MRIINICLDVGYSMYKGVPTTCKGGSDSENFISQQNAVVGLSNPKLEDKIEGCRKLCHDNIECMYFFVKVDYHNWCVLFKSCDEIKTSDDPGIIFTKQVTGKLFLWYLFIIDVIFLFQR